MTAKIAAALVAAQKDFGPALKSSTNPHFKSRYADLAACVEAVIDGLNKSGIALMQVTHDCDNGVIVETVFIHESGESLSSGRLHVPASKQDAQGYGSALTYARRYSLMAACGIAPEDDDGNRATRPEKAKAEEWTTVHDELLAQYWAAASFGTEALKAFHAEVPATEIKNTVWIKHGEALKKGAASGTGQ